MFVGLVMPVLDQVGYFVVFSPITVHTIKTMRASDTPEKCL